MSGDLKWTDFVAWPSRSAMTRAMVDSTSLYAECRVATEMGSGSKTQMSAANISHTVESLIASPPAWHLGRSVKAPAPEAGRRGSFR